MRFVLLYNKAGVERIKDFDRKLNILYLFNSNFVLFLSVLLKVVLR